MKMIMTTALKLVTLVAVVVGPAHAAYFEQVNFNDDECAIKGSTTMVAGILGDTELHAFDTCVDVTPDNNGNDTLHAKYACSSDDEMIVTSYSNDADCSETGTASSEFSSTCSSQQTSQCSTEDPSWTGSAVFAAVVTYYSDSACTTATGTPATYEEAASMLEVFDADEACASLGFGGVIASPFCTSDDELAYGLYAESDSSCSSDLVGQIIMHCVASDNEDQGEYMSAVCTSPSNAARASFLPQFAVGGGMGFWSVVAVAAVVFGSAGSTAAAAVFL